MQKISDKLITMKRIQRSRRKGFKSPKNCKYVGRPGKWGNPMKLIGDMIYIDAGYRRKHLDKYVFIRHGDLGDMLNLFRHIVNGSDFYDKDLQYWSNKFKELNIEELRNYDSLSCFCPLDSSCHADIYIEILTKNYIWNTD